MPRVFRVILRFWVMRAAAWLLATAMAGGTVRAAEPTRPLGEGAAPPAAVVAEEGNAAAGSQQRPSLAELAAAAAKPPAGHSLAGGSRKTPPPVVQGEPHPLAYRTILLRYFDWPPSGR